MRDSGDRDKLTGLVILGDLAKDGLRLVDQICHARADLMSIGNPFDGALPGPGPGCQRALRRLRLALHGRLSTMGPNDSRLSPPPPCRVGRTGCGVVGMVRACVRGARQGGKEPGSRSSREAQHRHGASCVSRAWATWFALTQ